MSHRCGLGMNKLALPELDTLVEIVKTAAARELVPRFARSDQQIKTDGSIVTVSDFAMQQASSDT